MKQALRATVIAVSLLILVTMGAACGSTKTKTAAGASTTAAPGSTTAAPESSVAGGNSTPSTVKATGGGSFCKQVADTYNNGIKNITPGLTPALLKKEAEASQQAMAAAESSAPDAIKADLVTEFTATEALFAALAKVNYDFTKMTPQATMALGTPQVRAAEARVSAYMKNVCGISIGAKGSTPPTG